VQEYENAIDKAFGVGAQQKIAEATQCATDAAGQFGLVFSPARSGSTSRMARATCAVLSTRSPRICSSSRRNR